VRNRIRSFTKKLRPIINHLVQSAILYQRVIVDRIPAACIVYCEGDVTVVYTMLTYCQMLWMRFFSGQQRNRFAGCLDLFISPASKARFIKAVGCRTVTYLASDGG
jgi:hypothetical protein